MTIKSLTRFMNLIKINDPWTKHDAAVQYKLFISILWFLITIKIKEDFYEKDDKNLLLLDIFF